jgi:hypothetical protein
MTAGGRLAILLLVVMSVLLVGLGTRDQVLGASLQSPSTGCSLGSCYSQGAAG